MPDDDYAQLLDKAVHAALSQPTEANLQHACSYAELSGRRLDVMAALSLTSAQYDSLCKGGPKVVAEPQAAPETSIAELVSGICDREAKIHALEISGTPLSVEQGNALLALKEKVGHGKWEAWWQFDENAARIRAVLGTSKKTIENHMRLAKYSVDHPEVLKMKLGDARVACGIYKIMETTAPKTAATKKEKSEPASTDLTNTEGEAEDSEQSEPPPTETPADISAKPRVDEEKWFNLPPVHSHRDEGRAFPLKLSSDNPDIVIDGELLATALSKSTRRELGNVFAKGMEFEGALVQIEAFPEGVMKITAMGHMGSFACTLLQSPGLLEIRRYFRGVFRAKAIYEATLNNTGPVCMSMVYDKLVTAEEINAAMIRAYREFAAFIATSPKAIDSLPCGVINDIGRIETARDALAKQSETRLLAESIVTAGEYGLTLSDDKYLSIIAHVSDQGPKEIFLRTPLLDNATHAKLLAHVAAVIDGIYKRSDEKTREAFKKEKASSRESIAARTDKLTLEPGRPAIQTITPVCEGVTLTVTTNPEPPAPQ